MVPAEHENLERLAKCGLRIPQLVAYDDLRFAGGIIHAFIITEEIPRAMAVDYLVHEWFGQQAEEDRKQKTDELIHVVARVVKLMHDHGFEHHDLLLRNMRVSEQKMSTKTANQSPHNSLELHPEECNNKGLA